jgi:hypothetical protein
MPCPVLFSARARHSAAGGRGPRRALATLSVGVLLAIGAVGAMSPASATGSVSGVFANGGPSGETGFGTWRALSIGLAHSFAPRSTWSDIELPSTYTGYWSKSIYRSHMMLSYAMLPTNQSATMSQGASGAYDSHFRIAAQHLVGAGMGNAIIRLGWELNGGWFKWSAKPDPSAYAAYYRHIVTAMRSVSGQSFRFVWSVSNGYYGWDPRKAFPGTAYVNYIGVGVYDSWWKHPATPQQRWNFLVNWNGTGVQAGLAFWTNYAASLGKPLAFPEWGVVNANASMAGGSGGGGDDPYFVQQMHNWVVNHNVAWETYFNADAGDGYHRLDTTRFPNAALSYRQLFGGI